MSNQLKGLLITLLGVLVIVPDSLFIRLIDANAMTIIFWRAGISCAVMAAYCTISDGWVKLGPAALLFAITEAAFAALLSRVALGERLTRRTILTILGALIGITIIASGTSDENPQRWLGDLAAVGVALSLGIAFTTVRHSPDLPIIPALTLAYLLAAIAAALIAPTFQLSGLEWLWITLNGAIFVPLGFALMAIGPRYITAAEVSLLILLEAVLAPILVWLVLGENPGLRVLVGGAIVLLVLLISNLFGLREKQLKPPRTQDSLKPTPAQKSADCSPPEPFQTLSSKRA